MGEYSQASVRCEHWPVKAGGGGERKYFMNSEIKLSLGLQISGGGGLGRGEENN